MNLRNHIIFGNENAEADDLLFPCKVNKLNPDEQKPILIGRWGIGKTALLLLQNKDQAEILKKLDPDYENIWYLSESSLDVFILSNLKNKYKNEPDIFIKSLEEIWKSEISRIYTLILSKSRILYRNSKGEHWDKIEKIAKTNKSLTKTLWKQLPSILDILTRGSDYGAFEKMKSSIDSLVSDSTYNNIVKCLKDIEQDEYLPSIVIEPIETPTSAIERQKGLAQYLIIALLNAFHKYFPPDNKNFHIRISIPWHRYVIKETDFPQKIYQYKGFVEWNKYELKEFINRRIEWEFKRVGRKYSLPTNRSAWDILFEEKIENGWCMPSVKEDSFDYFLRHTHYRARDILRLCREVVFEAAKQLQISVDDVLRTKQIKASIIIDTFHKVGHQLTKQLLEEGNRRFPGLYEITSVLRGLAIPFTTDDLSKRIKKINSFSYNDAVNILWDSGILGVIAIPKSDQCSKRLILAFTDKAKRIYTNRQNERNEIWTWFEHNYEGRPNDILSKLLHFEKINYGLVLHPKTFEYFIPYPTELKCPIGI